MNIVKQTLLLLLGGLMVHNSTAAESSQRPLHVLYLGPVEAGGNGRGGGFGGARTNYIYLPGQTLAPEAIYFDHLSSASNLTPAYLKHFDAVVQVMPDTDLNPEQQKLLENFKRLRRKSTNEKVRFLDLRILMVILLVWSNKRMNYKNKFVK